VYCPKTLKKIRQTQSF